MVKVSNPNNLRGMQTLLDDAIHEGIELEAIMLGKPVLPRLTQDLHTDKHSISDDDLRRYDRNIVQHWQQVTEKRNEAEGFEQSQILSIPCLTFYRILPRPILQSL